MVFKIGLLATHGEFFSSMYTPSLMFYEYDLEGLVERCECFTVE